jgi:hypothetical protein
VSTNPLSNWLQIAGNIGIIGGLILVALQMNQNSDLLATQLIYMESERQLNLETAMMGEDPADVWAKSMDGSSELTSREQRILDAYLYIQIEQWRAVYQISESGLIEDEWKDRIDMDIEYVLNNPHGREYWQAIKARMPAELATYIDGHLSLFDNLAQDSVAKDT